MSMIGDAVLAKVNGSRSNDVCILWGGGGAGTGVLERIWKSLVRCVGAMLPRGTKFEIICRKISSFAVGNGMV